MYSLSNMASRSGTPVQGQTTTAALMHHPSYASSQNNLLGAGTGILVGGPNHHATINPQYGMEHLNGSSILSHSHTLPHNLSHHNSKHTSNYHSQVHVLIQNVHTGYHASPDIINHQQHTLGHPSTRTRHQAAINPYNTMGRLPSHHQYQQVGSVLPPPERGSMDPLMMAASESNESQLTDNRSFDIIRQTSSAAGTTEQKHQFAEGFAG